MDQTKGFTFIDGIKEIIKHKILFLIFTLISGLVIFVALFIYGRVNEKAVSDFSIAFPKMEENKYPNNTLFDFNKMVSMERLESIKASDGKYSNVNIGDMIYKQAIKLRKVSAGDIDGMGVQFRIFLDCNYFPNKDIASDFVMDVVDFEIKEIEARSTTNLTDFINTPNIGDFEYLEYINSLSNQFDEIIDKYTELVESSQVTHSGLNILTKIESIKAGFLNGDIFTALETEVISNKYVKKPGASNQIISSKILDLTSKKIVLEKTIADLIQAAEDLPAGGSNNLSGILAEQILLLNEVNAELDIYIALQTGSVAPQSFIEKLSALETRLVELSDEYALTYSYVISQNTSIYFNGEKGIIDFQKPVSTVISILIAIVGGVAVGLVCVYIKYQVVKEKDKKALVKEEQ